MSDEKDQPTENRIIVDENYKAQVQAEKERAAAGPAETQKTTRRRPPLPEASFSLLLASFATQAMVSLGLVTNPLRREPNGTWSRPNISSICWECLSRRPRGTSRLTSSDNWTRYCLTCGCNTWN